MTEPALGYPAPSPPGGPFEDITIDVFERVRSLERREFGDHKVKRQTPEQENNRMAVDGDDPTEPRQNLLEKLLERVREEYREEHGEDPPESFMEDARREAVLRIARHRRDSHRDVYDALADE